jgi:uncharacterized Zn-finger protein
MQEEFEEDRKFFPFLRLKSTSNPSIIPTISAEEAKYEETPTEDDDYEFQFCLEDSEYFEILKELRTNDEEDLEDLKINCPHENCKRAFSRQHNLLKHLKCHELGMDKAGSVCHICGKFIRGVYSLHLKIHEDQKQFRCDECGKEFRQKIALNNHCEYWLVLAWVDG